MPEFLSSSPLVETPEAAELDGAQATLRAGSSKLDFSRRAELEEWMDQPCSYEDLRDCLHDIARINRLTFAYRPTLSWLDEVTTARPKHAGPLRIVDVGCGYGDMLRRIDGWAYERGITVALTGIDNNGNAIRAAREATPASCNVEWLVADALSGSLAGKIDVVVCSLLTHHLQNEQIIRFLEWMEENAQCGWFINDLHRKPFPYHAFCLWSKVAPWHRFARHDGPVSIRRSFVAEDWRRLCSAAGLMEPAVSLREYRPARLCVARIRQPIATRSFDGVSTRRSLVTRR